jgi:hypothetical protein
MLFAVGAHADTHTRPDEVETHLIVDAPNVRRSRWPNMAADELVARTIAWARGRGVRPVVVFDGRAPGGVVGVAALPGGGELVGTGQESADDWIAREAPSRAPFWLVTSDRGLRARTPGAEQTIGGGAFVRELAHVEVR